VRANARSASKASPLSVPVWLTPGRRWGVERPLFVALVDPVTFGVEPDTVTVELRGREEKLRCLPFVVGLWSGCNRGVVIVVRTATWCSLTVTPSCKRRAATSAAAIATSLSAEALSRHQRQVRCMAVVGWWGQVRLRQSGSNELKAFRLKK
jgi:hypothetical protein